MWKNRFLIFISLISSNVILGYFSFKDGKSHPDKIQSTTFPMLGKYANPYSFFSESQAYELDDKQVRVFLDSNRYIADALGHRMAPQVEIVPFLVLTNKLSDVAEPYNIVKHAILYDEFRQQLPYVERKFLQNFSVNVDFALFGTGSGGIVPVEYVLNQFTKPGPEVNVHDIHYSPNNLQFNLDAGRDFVFFVTALYLDKFDKVELSGPGGKIERSFYFVPPKLFLTFFLVNLVNTGDKPELTFDLQHRNLRDLVEELKVLQAGVANRADVDAIESVINLVEAKSKGVVVPPKPAAAMPVPVPSPELEARIRACLAG